MQHDVRLRDAARAIYDACYPSEEWSLVPFDVAERHGTIHYRQAVDAVWRVRSVLIEPAATQLALI
jgi:hypothetical protein